MFKVSQFPGQTAVCHKDLKNPLYKWDLGTLDKGTCLKIISFMFIINEQEIKKAEPIREFDGVMRKQRVFAIPFLVPVYLLFPVQAKLCMLED